MQDELIWEAIKKIQNFEHHPKCKQTFYRFLDL